MQVSSAWNESAEKSLLRSLKSINVLSGQKDFENKFAVFLVPPVGLNII